MPIGQLSARLSALSVPQLLACTQALGIVDVEGKLAIHPPLTSEVLAEALLTYCQQCGSNSLTRLMQNLPNPLSDESLQPSLHAALVKTLGIPPGDVFTALLTHAAPRQEERIQPDWEVESIREVLEPPGLQYGSRIEVRGALTVASLQLALQQFNPHLFHFSGHCLGEEGLTFLDERGYGHELSGKGLAALLALSPRLKLVVMSACDSAVMADALTRHLLQPVPHVVGVLEPLFERDARTFTRAFYRTLMIGQSVKEAVQQAQAALAAEKSTHVPVLQYYHLGQLVR